MKKVLLLIMLLGIVVPATAQEFLRIEKIMAVGSANGSWAGPTHEWDSRRKIIYLSNGKKLELWAKGPALAGSRTNLRYQNSYKRGDLIYHVADLYWYEPVKYIGERTIKRVARHDIDAEFRGRVTGSFSYGSFFALFAPYGGGGGNAKGNINGNINGGKKTVMNVILDNNEAFSVAVADDPLWLEAKTGMRVKHYQVRDAHLYKLVIE